MADKPVKILIVDDDVSILTLLDEMFQSEEDLNIRTESDSQAAYELLGNEQFDLLITDLMMPKVDGLMLLEHARALYPNILVVIITGYASLETTLEAIHAGAYDYITKPFRLEEFRLLVNNAAARIQLMKQVSALHEERRTLEARLSELEEEVHEQESEVDRLRSELARRNAQPPGGPSPESSPTRQLTSYQRMLETAEERYERQLVHLEDLFSSGRLTSEEFDVARQSLKTMI
ncbi:MAG: response regulator [Candidatus Sumerlaeota bacterium]